MFEGVCLFQYLQIKKFKKLLLLDGGRYGDRYRRERDYEERDRRRDESRTAREQVITT